MPKPRKGESIEVAGAAAAGAAISDNPVPMGISDGTNVQYAKGLSTGHQGIVLMRSDGTAVLNTYGGGSDGVSTSQNVIGVWAEQILFNGATFDRARATTAVTALASAARTATINSSDIINYNHRGLLLVVDVSSAGTGSITPSIQIKDSVSGNYRTIWTAAAALTANGTAAYMLYPGAASAALYTEAIQAVVGRTFRVVATHNNANSITYSASVDLVL